MSKCRNDIVFVGQSVNDIKQQMLTNDEGVIAKLEKYGSQRSGHLDTCHKCRSKTYVWLTGLVPYCGSCLSEKVSNLKCEKVYALQDLKIALVVLYLQKHPDIETIKREWFDVFEKDALEKALLTSQNESPK